MDLCYLQITLNSMLKPHPQAEVRAEEEKGEWEGQTHKPNTLDVQNLKLPSLLDSFLLQRKVERWED